MADLTGMILSAAGAAAGNTSRDYVLYESVDATTQNIRYGTIDISDGTSTETSFFNAYSATFANFNNSKVSLARVNGYIGYQTGYGFYIYRENGTVVGSKVSAALYFINTSIGVQMCVCGDFIIGIEPTNSNNFKVWKFDTTTEVFTELVTEYSPNNRVFGATYLKPNIIGYSFINSSNFNQFKQIDLSTNTVSSLYTGSFTWNFSYPAAARMFRYDDDHYIRNYLTSLTVSRMEVVNYSTSAVIASVDLTANVGATNKQPFSAKFVEGEHTSYIMFGFNYAGSGYGIAINKDLSSTPYVAFQGYLGRTTRNTMDANVNGFAGYTTSQPYAYDNILVDQEKVYDPGTLRQIDSLTTTAGVISNVLYISPGEVN